MKADVLPADDLRQVYNLIANYMYAVDEPDRQLFETVWAEESTYRLVRDVAGLGAPLVGRNAIIAAFNAYWDRQPERPPGSYARHVCTNPRIDVRDGVVTGKTAMVLVFQELAGERINMGVRRSGAYFDRFVVERGRWVFADRLLEYDPPERPGVELPVALYGRRVGG